jgi:phosphatidylglycerophosphatase A
VRWIEKVLGSVFFSGYFPLFPATIGSAVTCVAYWFLVPQRPGAQMAIIAVVFILGLHLSSRLMREWGPDPGRIVVDEAAGMLVSLFMLPKSLFLIVLAFLLFRLFDIAKPFPIRRMDELESGWGIMLDDLVAGVYARLAMFVIVLVWSGLR